MQKESRNIVVLLGVSALLIWASGCGPRQDVSRMRPYAPARLAWAQAPANPWLIFQTPPGRTSGIDPENMGRYPWPLAEVPGGYVSGPEIISYREYHYSDQYRSDGKARDRLNRRIYGVRAVEQIR